MGSERPTCIELSGSMNCCWNQTRVALRQPAGGMPFPRGFHDGINIRKSRLPTQNFTGAPRVGNKRGWIALASRGIAKWNLVSRGAALNRRNYFTYRVSPRGAKIHRCALPAIHQVPQREYMSFRQVRHVDVVPDCRAGGGRIVGPINFNKRTLPKRGLKNQGNQVGLRVMVFADLALWIGARRIKVSERNRTKAVGGAIPMHGAFRHHLGFAVGIDGTKGVILRDRHFFRYSKYCGG